MVARSWSICCMLRVETLATNQGHLGFISFRYIGIAEERVLSMMCPILILPRLAVFVAYVKSGCWKTFPPDTTVVGHCCSNQPMSSISFQNLLARPIPAIFRRRAEEKSCNLFQDSKKFSNSPHVCKSLGETSAFSSAKHNQKPRIPGRLQNSTCLERRRIFWRFLLRLL